MSEASDATGESTAPRPNGSKAGKLGTKGIVAIIIVAAILVAVPLGYLVLKSDDARDGGTYTVTVVGKAGDAELDRAELEDMAYVEAVSSYQNKFMNWRGLGTYRGVELRDIADVVGGMAPGDIMTVEAADGYIQNLSYYQVYPDPECLMIQGRTILAYSFNGTEAPEWEDGPMIAVLAPDEAYSNEDFNATCARDPEFLSSTSASAIWVKNVANVTVSERYDEWTVALEDLDGVDRTLTRTKFVSLGYTFGESFVDTSLRNWSGVPVETVLGVIDDDDPCTFNETLAEKGYRVNISDAAEEVYYKVLDVNYLLADTALLADKMNGTALDEDDAPLRLVGPLLSKKEWVAGIAYIGMLEPYVLTLKDYDSSIDLTMNDIKAMSAITASGGLIKSTGTIVGPNEYTGVLLKDLVDMVNDSTEYSVEVVGTDGYVVTYNYAQVEDGEFEHYDAVTGESLGVSYFDMIVAYDMDGLPLEDMNLRAAVVGGDDPITDGHFWVKDVRKINVITYVEEWEIALEGLTTLTIDRQTFESVASCPEHQLSYTYMNETMVEHTYTGVALWILVSAVDEADGPDGEYLFNDLLAQAGYTVTVASDLEGEEDDYAKDFSSLMVARNDTLIVANKLDGEPLPEDEFPLKLVGAGLAGSLKVKCITNITATGISPIADWSVWINGTRDVSMSAATFVSTYYSTLHGPWFNYTVEGGWHAAYYNYTDELEVEHSYAGIPLWVLLSCVDGDDTDHYPFNESLAEEGYTVVITGSDGSSTTLTSAEIKYNSSLVIAFMLDGEPLPGDETPLRLVSEWLSDSQKVSMIISIEIELAGV